MRLRRLLRQHLVRGGHEAWQRVFKRRDELAARPAHQQRTRHVVEKKSAVAKKKAFPAPASSSRGGDDDQDGAANQLSDATPLYLFVLDYMESK